MMRTTLANLWPVLAAIALVQLANGIQSDLIGVRAGLAAFSPRIIGIVMACYYVGYSSAPLFARRIIAGAGPIAAIMTAAIAAAALIVAHAYLITPTSWAVFRIALGFALATLYVAIESWINASVENAQRGRVFSAYVLIQMISMTAAQGVFGAGNPANASLFLLAGALFAAGAVPMLAAHAHGQSDVPPEPLHIGELFRISPLGAAATVFAGLSWAAVVTFGPVYAQERGMSVAETGLFMGVAMAGGMAMQLPLGWLSDHFGRRRTIALMSAGAVVVSLLGLLADRSGLVARLVVMAFLGGFVFTLYAIAVARTNDAVKPQNRVAAAAGLVMLFGLGSIGGPLITGWAMSAVGPSAYFLVLAGIMTASFIAAVTTR